MPRHSPGTGINLPKVLANAVAVQGEMEEAKVRLRESEVEGRSGGGLVTVRLGGDLVVREVSVDPAALEEDAELVGEMVQAAINQAIGAARELAASMLGGITAGGSLREGL